MNDLPIMKGIIMHYILDKKKVIQEPDLITWAKWLENADRIVKQEVVGTTPAVKISTVFLGIDHNFKNQGEPLLFETMVSAES